MLGLSNREYQKKFIYFPLFYFFFFFFPLLVFLTCHFMFFRLGHKGPETLWQQKLSFDFHIFLLIIYFLSLLSSISRTQKKIILASGKYLRE